MKTLLSHDAVLENITVHPSEGRSLICGKYILVISSTASKIVHKEVVETLRHITGEKCNDWSTLVSRFDLKIPLAMILLNQSRSGGNKLKLFQLLCPSLELFLGILFMSLWSTLKCAKVKKKIKKSWSDYLCSHTFDISFASFISHSARLLLRLAPVVWILSHAGKYIYF